MEGGSISKVVRKSKGESTRDVIIEKAILLFAKKGYEQTSLQEIADESKLSQAAPLYHFKSKEGLFRAAIEAIQKNKREVTSRGVEPKDDAMLRLLKLYRGHIAWAEIYRLEAVVFLLLHHFASFDLNFTEVYQAILAAERHDLEVMIAAGQRERIFKTKQAPSLLAEVCHDALIGMVVNLLAGRGAMNSPRQLEKKVKLILQTTLGCDDGKE